MSLTSKPALPAVLRLAIKILFTTGLFWLALRGIKPTELLAIWEQQRHELLFEALILLFIQLWLGALRWRLILKTLLQQGVAMLSQIETLRIYYISTFFNFCLPGTVGGDVVRVWLTKSDHVPMTTSIHSVIIDRIIALIALVALIALTLPYLADLVHFPAIPVLLFLFGAGIIGIVMLALAGRILAPWQHIAPVRWFLYFLGSLKLLLRYPLASFMSLWFAVAAHACFCFAAYTLAVSLGLTLTPLQCITLIPPVVLAATLPLSIGGWGLREAGMVTMLSLAAVPQKFALLLSIQLGLGGMLISLPGGLLWLLARRKKQSAA